MSEPPIIQIVPSAAMRALLEQLAESMLSTRELVDKICLQAKSEGLQPQHVKELLVAALKRCQLSERTIRAYLPIELKDPHMVAVRSRQHRQLPVATIATTLTQASCSSIVEPKENASSDDNDGDNNAPQHRQEIIVLTERIEQLQQENEALAARAEQLQEAFKSIDGGIVTADKMTMTTTTTGNAATDNTTTTTTIQKADEQLSVIVVPQTLHAQIFLGIQHHVTTILLHVNSSGLAVSVDWSDTSSEARAPLA